MLTITPISGLCNRLFALHGALCLAKDLGQPLRVVWKQNNHLGARFEDLFEVPEEIVDIVTFERRSASLGTRLREEVRRHSSWPPLRRGPRGRDVIAMCEAGYDFRRLGQQRNPALQAFTLFYGQDRPFFPFRPVPHLRDRIDAVMPADNARIGIHIRRGDHLPARMYSPTDLFITEMENALRTDPAARFLLCTDGEHEESLLKQRFPDRLVTIPKRSLDRAQKTAAEDAVVDLFALSRCQRVIGSLASTFSQAAGLIGGIDVHHVTTEADPTLYWRVEDLPDAHP